MNFHNFGPDPSPPLKVVKPQFFFYSITKKYYVQIKKDSPLKTQKNYKINLIESSKFSKYISQGVAPPPWF